MSQVDNVQDIAFSTAFTIDKIIQDEESESYVVSSGFPTIPTTTTQTVAHTKGASVIVSARYSIDGTNYYPSGTPIEGAKDGVTNQRQFALLYSYADDDTVYFWMSNGFTSNKTFSISYVLESLS